MLKSLQYCLTFSVLDLILVYMEGSSGWHSSSFYRFIWIIQTALKKYDNVFLCFVWPWHVMTFFSNLFVAPIFDIHTIQMIIKNGLSFKKLYTIILLFFLYSPICLFTRTLYKLSIFHTLFNFTFRYDFVMKWTHASLFSKKFEID